MNDLASMFQGATDPPAHWYFQDENGNPTSMPNGTTYALIIANKVTGATQLGAGTCTVVSASQVDYQWNATDTAVPGDYVVFLQYTLPTGRVGYSQPVDWSVQELSL